MQELGLLQWFDARSSTTPFNEDLRAFLKLHEIGGRIDYAWVAAVENWRALVGPEVSAEVDAIDEIEWAVNSSLFTWSRASRADKVWPKIPRTAIASFQQNCAAFLGENLNGTANAVQGVFPDHRVPDLRQLRGDLEHRVGLIGIKFEI